MNPAVETVRFKTSSGNRQKDCCTTHLQELLHGSRAPKRGRKPSSTGAVAATSAAGARKATGRKRPTRKKVTARKKATVRKQTRARRGYSTNGKRLGRPAGSKNKTRSPRKTA